MECVSSASFEILINRGKFGQFKPGRGLRQGDPLSPYLFILGQLVLSRMLQKEFGKKNISEVKANIRGPIITHVMYANDIILFLTACRKYALAISECLDKYCTWLDQLINRGRSGIFSPKPPKNKVARSSNKLYKIGLRQD